MHNVNKEKHCRDMLILAKEYDKVHKRIGVDKDIKVINSQIKERIYWSAQNAIFDALFVSEAFLKDIMSELKELGLYPFPLQWGRVLAQKSLKMKFLYLIELPLR